MDEVFEKRMGSLQHEVTMGRATDFEKFLYERRFEVCFALDLAEALVAERELRGTPDSQSFDGIATLVAHTDTALNGYKRAQANRAELEATKRTS